MYGTILFGSSSPMCAFPVRRDRVLSSGKTRKVLTVPRSPNIDDCREEKYAMPSTRWSEAELQYAHEQAERGGHISLPPGMLELQISKSAIHSADDQF